MDTIFINRTRANTIVNFLNERIPFSLQMSIRNGSRASIVYIKDELLVVCFKNTYDIRDKDSRIICIKGGYEDGEVTLYTNNVVEDVIKELKKKEIYALKFRLARKKAKIKRLNKTLSKCNKK
jgi:hypothetical protein